jgi:hypothetical protein
VPLPAFPTFVTVKDAGGESVPTGWLSKSLLDGVIASWDAGFAPPGPGPEGFFFGFRHFPFLAAAAPFFAFLQFFFAAAAASDPRGAASPAPAVSALRASARRLQRRSAKALPGDAAAFRAGRRLTRSAYA